MALKKKKLRGSGEVRIDTKDLLSPIALYIGGDLGGGLVRISAFASDIRTNVADGGPFSDTTKVDSFNEPHRRIVIWGRADEIAVSVTGTDSADLDITVR